MYSLVSASVMAIDFARHPHGALLADTVDRVLTLSPDEVAALAAAAAAHPAERATARARLRDECTSEPRMSSLMRGVAAVWEDGVPSPSEARTMVQALSDTLLGSYGDLSDMLRRELQLQLQALPPAGVDAALDAVLAAWVGAPDGKGVLAEDLALLQSPWLLVLSPVPVSLPYADYAGGDADLRVLLEALPRLCEQQWAALVRIREENAGGPTWALSMHEASRAAWRSGRLPAVARAQLAAARVVRLSSVSTTPAASAAMMMVTAAVQATCLRDVLPDVTRSALLDPWITATALA